MRAAAQSNGAMRKEPAAIAVRLALLVLLGPLLAIGAHAQGTPQRIVSLDLCADQLLIDLVPRGRIAALTHLAGDASVSAVAEKARGLPVTHGQAEDVLRRDPDLVLAGPYGVSATVALLKRMGRRVVTVPLASDLDGVRRAVEVVAEAAGETDAGKAAIAQFDARLAVVAESAKGGRGPSPSALVYQVGGSTSVEGTLADAALVAAGFRNAARRYPHARTSQVPLEAIIADPPDLMVLSSAPQAYRTPVADNLRHPVLAALSRQVPVIELPWRQWLCGTPHVMDAIESLAAARRGMSREATQ